MAAPLGIKLPAVSHYQKNTDEAGRFACINTCRILFFAYAYSGLMAGISSVVLTNRMFSGRPTAGDSQEMEAIVATVLGGASMLGGQVAMGSTVIGVRSWARSRTA
jgi:ribose transport system permease protein